MEKFKFLRSPLLHSHEQKSIYVGEMFFSVAKESYWVTWPSGKRTKTKKYSIALRYISPKDRDRFRPNHELFWYFKHKSTAEFYVGIWKRQDKAINNIL